MRGFGTGRVEELDRPPHPGRDQIDDLEFLWLKVQQHLRVANQVIYGGRPERGTGSAPRRVGSSPIRAMMNPRASSVARRRCSRRSSSGGTSSGIRSVCQRRVDGALVRFGLEPDPGELVWKSAKQRFMAASSGRRPDARAPGIIAVRSSVASSRKLMRCSTSATIEPRRHSTVRWWCDRSRLAPLIEP